MGSEKGVSFFIFGSFVSGRSLGEVCGGDKRLNRTQDCGAT